MLPAPWPAHSRRRSVGVSVLVAEPVVQHVSFPAPPPPPPPVEVAPAPPPAPAWPLLVQVLVSQLDPRRLGSFAVGVIAMLTAGARLEIQWSLTKMLLLGEVVLGSMLLLLGLFMIEATVSFFSVKSIEMVNILTYGGRSACQYPVDVYPGVLRFLFTWLAPIALCMHWPVAWVLGQPMTALAPGWYFVTPLAGAVFFLLMTRVWYWGVKRYRSTGT